MVRRLMKMLKAYVQERREGLVPRGVVDPRRKRPKYKLDAVWRTTVLMLCTMQVSIRSATRQAQFHSGRLVCEIARTALSDVLSRLDWEQVREVLRRMVRVEYRRKALRPDGLPIGVVAIDGRTNWVGDEKVNEYCQRSHKDDADKTPYWSFRVLRAVLVSAACRLCIDETPIPADTNDMGAFESFFLGLVEAYRRGALFEVVTGDAGFCSEANARLVDREGYSYVFGLKDNQPELRAEAERVLGAEADARAPDACSAWEREKGQKVQRRLWRTRELAGWLAWTHLRQVWLVRKVAQTKDGTEKVIEDRYFVSNLPVGRLTSEQILELVRRHWAIENDCFRTVDVHWLEDSGMWCRKGNGLLVCSLLRMIAYNIVTLLRSVHGKSASWREMPWKTVASWIRDYIFATTQDRSLVPSFV